MSAIRSFRWGLGFAACVCPLLVASCDRPGVATNEPGLSLPRATRLIAASPLSAFAQPGAEVVSAPTVWVADSSGVVPIPGVRVAFAVTAGGGVVGATSVATDANGIATVGSWRLGNNPGMNTVLASAPGLGAIVFTATGLARQLRAEFDLQTIGGAPLPWSISGGGASVTITGGSYVLYDDGTCVHTWDGFGGPEPCRYVLTGQLDGQGLLEFYNSQPGGPYATGACVDGTMTVTYADAIDFETEVYKLATSGK